jgi:hypothetical protein
VDLKAMTDPDVVRAVVGDNMDPPELEHHEPETLQSAEAFGTRERVYAQGEAEEPAQQRPNQSAPAQQDWAPTPEQEAAIRQREIEEAQEAQRGQQAPAPAAPARRTRPVQGSMD